MSGGRQVHEGVGVWTGVRPGDARPDPRVPRALWLPFAAWGAFLLLAVVAQRLGAGVFSTALLALLPFGLAGGLLRRTGKAIALTLGLGLAIALVPGLLDALGQKPGATLGAAVVGALALPLGANVGHHRRGRRAKAAPARVAGRPTPGKPPAAKAPGEAAKPGGGDARRPRA